VSPRLRGLAWIAGLGAVGVALLFLRQVDPATSRLYPGCVWKAWTGWDCPGCGGLRATHHLLHGRWLEAFRYNPLYVLALPIMAVGLGRWLWRRWRIGPVPPRIGATFPLAWFFTALGIILSYGVVRNLPWPAFRWLATP